MRLSSRTEFAVCSWSGGKDACLAFDRAASSGVRPSILLTILTEDGKRSRSNGVKVSVLRAQADALGATLLAVPATWSRYERVFRRALEKLVAIGATVVVFGDRENEKHREWDEEICLHSGLTAFLPLWEMDAISLLTDIEQGGYRVHITAARADVLGPEYLGRTIGVHVARDMHARGLDPCGERGEYHTVVSDAPSFCSALSLTFERPTLRHGHWHSEVDIAIP